MVQDNRVEWRCDGGNASLITQAFETLIDMVQGCEGNREAVAGKDNLRALLAGQDNILFFRNAGSRLIAIVNDVLRDSAITRLELKSRQKVWI